MRGAHRCRAPCRSTGCLVGAAHTVPPFLSVADNWSQGLTWNRAYSHSTELCCHEKCTVALWQTQLRSQNHEDIVWPGYWFLIYLFHFLYIYFFINGQFIFFRSTEGGLRGKSISLLLQQCNNKETLNLRNTVYMRPLFGSLHNLPQQLTNNTRPQVVWPPMHRVCLFAALFDFITKKAVFGAVLRHACV